MLMFILKCFSLYLRLVTVMNVTICVVYETILFAVVPGILERVIAFVLILDSVEVSWMAMGPPLEILFLGKLTNLFLMNITVT